MIGKRIWFKGKGWARRSFVVTVPPFPRIGDKLFFEGQERIVAKVKDEEIFAVFERDGTTLRQTYPGPKREEVGSGEETSTVSSPDPPEAH